MHRPPPGNRALLNRDFAIVIDPSPSGSSRQILTRAGFFRHGACIRLLLDDKAVELALADNAARGHDFEVLTVMEETAELAP
jgi:hypothetical protein